MSGPVLLDARLEISEAPLELAWPKIGADSKWKPAREEFLSFQPRISLWQSASP